MMKRLRMTMILVISFFMFFTGSLCVLAEDIGNETKILDYNVLNDYSDNIYFTSDKFAIIKGDLVDFLLVDDVISQIRIDELITEYEITGVNIVKDSVSLEENEDLEEVLNVDDIVLNGMRLVFDDDNVYNIIVVGDVYSDGIVDSLDVNKIIYDYLNNDCVVGPLLDVNNDGYFNNLDVTFIMNAVNTKSWDNVIEPVDSLVSNLVVNKENIYVNDEFEISYLINGFQLDFINGIEGNLIYDKDYLQYISYSINGFNGIINEDGRFMFIGDDSVVSDDFDIEVDNSDKQFILTIKFRAIKDGNTSVLINDVIASMNGVKLNLDSDLVFSNIVIDNYGVGGDIETDSDNNDDSSEDNNKNNDNDDKVVEDVVVDSKSEVTNLVVRPIVNNNVVNKKEESNNKVATVISLSNDNYIKSLDVRAYEIDFDMNKYEYSISVPYEIDSLDLDIVLNNDKASYDILGNDKFSVGRNVVEIVVTAEDGNQKTYTINVNKEDKEEDMEEEVSNSSRVVIIILIVLVIIGLVYVIFKDDEEDES